jgi:negative regulator of flagellin synthesis FlgM
MKVGNTPDKPALQPATPGRSGPVATGRSADQVAETRGAAGEQSSTVALSSTATALLDGVSASNAEFDTAKVSRISNAISSGNFTVNPDAIADKLIANAQELLSRAAH